MTAAEKKLICIRIDDIKSVLEERYLSPTDFSNILNALKKDITSI
ncbi:hypothetical protein [Liquorilactobacillus mali]|nr:hypothetical protein [Liquorilactobacillus mali]